ncbi:MAG TPA: polysaccharide pyruvyl transferase family protein [Thermomicrobiales bacterium]|jgi:polysaccharide pyruvyl transferase WcaK-like protein
MGSEQHNAERTSREIVIVGAAGFTNLGDDAILAAMIVELRAAIPGVRLVVATGDPAMLTIDSPWGGADVTPLSFDDAAIAQALTHADLLIVGGGGFIYDYDARISAHAFLHGDDSLFYPHYRAIVTAHTLGVPIHLYAIGVGPLVTAAGRGLTRTVLSLVSAITVRDPLSLVELHTAGLRHPVPQLTADPALGLAPSDTRKVSGNPPLIGIVARAWLRLGGGWAASGREHFERYIDWLAAGADYAVERWGAVPLFLPLQRRYDDDREIEAQVIARMRHGGRARLLDDLGDFRALQATLGGLDALVSTRLHPLILAGIAGVPPIGVALSPKIRAFLQPLGLHEQVLSPWLARDADLRAALDRALGEPEPLRARLRIGIAAQAKAAARNPAIAAALFAPKVK